MSCKQSCFRDGTYGWKKTVSAAGVSAPAKRPYLSTSSNINPVNNRHYDHPKKNTHLHPARTTAYNLRIVLAFLGLFYGRRQTGAEMDGIDPQIVASFGPKANAFYRLCGRQQRQRPHTGQEWIGQNGDHGQSEDSRLYP
jgi:hypothetical protein